MITPKKSITTGRLETRRYWVCDDLNTLPNPERRYFICSIAADAKLFAHAVRAHWGIENRLHWRLDVIMREDDCRFERIIVPPS